jgi:hypothetical protein
MAEQLRFLEDRIIVSGYPFSPSSRSSDLTIQAQDIAEADIDRCTVHAQSELIYLPGWPREELSEFCQRNHIRVRPRYDVWADILDPFVDTSFTSKEVRDRNNRLRQGGFLPCRVFCLRLLYALPIVWFQGLAGEWTGLYHFHLLHALRYLRLVGLYRLAYKHTMKIALEPYSYA